MQQPIKCQRLCRASHALGMMHDNQPPVGLNRYHRYFCYVCGSLLPHKISVNDSLVCSKCSNKTYLSWFVGMKVKFGVEKNQASEVTNLQTLPSFAKLIADAQKTLRSEEVLRKAGEILPEPDSCDGPSVQRDCPYCGNSRMSYVTMQLRAADEGQTVIYTCTQCKKKEIENT